MNLKAILRRLIRKTGYDITRFPTDPESMSRRKKFFEAMSFDTVLDVGANSGIFGEYTRKKIGYKNKIVSFEPLSSAFSALKVKADRDPNWSAYNYALGADNAKREINIAGNSYSSSLLRMLPTHVDAAPHSRYVGKEWIEIKTLDGIRDTAFNLTGKIYLKIDTQGFEKAVLMGAQESLASIDTIQLEMSLVPLYAGESLYNEMYSYLQQRGFGLIDIEIGFTDPTTGRLLQVDGIFQKVSLRDPAGPLLRGGNL